MVAVHIVDDSLRHNVAMALAEAGLRVRRSRAQVELAKNLSDGAVRVVVTTDATLSMSATASCPLVIVATTETVPEVVARALAVAVIAR